MGWIWDFLSQLPTDIQDNVALSTRASSSRAGSNDGPRRPREINDYVHEVSSPSSSEPSVELVFFHGLQLGKSQETQEAHLDTWIAEDGSGLWLNWILEQFPKARILVISYDAHAHRNETDGNMDMFVTTENLLQCLIGGAQVGQNKCPVILVGHCIGGLVMKELCVYATKKVALAPTEVTQPVQKFLDQLKGLFFYATPHHGTRLAESNTVFTKGILFERSAPLNPEAARLSEDFRMLRVKKRWRTYGIVENVKVTLGRFSGLIVEEASARSDVDGFYTAPETNHFNVCRPKSTNSSNYSLLVEFIDAVMKEAEGQIHDEEPVHKIYSGLPAYIVGLTTRAQEVQKLLKGGAVLGIFGMGGIGKSTLVREVFNNISKEFEYTCFVDTVKGFAINDLEKVVLENFHHKGVKLDGAQSEWSRMKGKKTLVAMDDADSIDQLRVLPAWQHFGDGSCLIITSRNQRIFAFHENCKVHELQFLDTTDATKLFCKHAFGSDRIPPRDSGQLAHHVKSLVGKCGGLPLTLEVMGRYLRNETSDEVWEDTLDNLQKAISVEGVQNEDDRLWATLEVSYNKLSSQAQDLFCDAATFLFGERLDTALAAWSNRKAETTWRILVDRAMVKEVTMTKLLSIGGYLQEVQYKEVWVHEQLRDLAKKLSKGTMVQGSKNNVKAVVDQLNAKMVNENTKSLRLGSCGDAWDATLRVDSLVWLKELKYVEIHGIADIGEGKGLPEKLRLLSWEFDSAIICPFQISLIQLTDLAVLQLSGFVIPNDFPETLGKLINLRILKLSHCEVPEGLGEALGKLKHLHVLSLTDLTVQMQSRRENFSNLSQLEQLELVKVEYLRLAESFGQHTRLKELTIDTRLLETLPDSFGALKSLRRLRLAVPKLERLPNSFGRLSSLEELTLSCSQLKSLSDDFGQMATLKDLSIVSDELETLPDSFGSLKALRAVTLQCPKLDRLPDGFGRLSSLEKLTLERCRGLKRLSDDFGQLASLTDLTIESEELESLPNSFGALESIRLLTLGCPKLERLPEGFGRLRSLKTLKLGSCWALKRLSDDFGQLTTLKDLAIQSSELESLPGNFGALKSMRRLVLQCPKLKQLPEGFGRLSSLKYITIRNCGQLKNLSDDFGQLASLMKLIIRSHALQSLPDSFGGLKSMRNLLLQCPKLKQLPEGFGRLSSLEKLRLRECKQLESLSDDFGQLTTLMDLTIRSQVLQSLPDNFGALKSMRNLLLHCPKLKQLPEDFGKLSSLQHLTLRNCEQLKSLSDDFGQLATLMDLTIQSDVLQSLPDNFGALKSMRNLRLQCPKLKQLPQGFGSLSSLEKLGLQKCRQLKSLSEDFGELAALEDLTIESKKLKRIPDRLGDLNPVPSVLLDCPKLERLPEGWGSIAAKSKDSQANLA